MAANIIRLTQVDASAVSTFNVFNNIENQEEDIFYHLGTNLGTTSWSNPHGVSVVATATENTLQFGSFPALFDQDEVSGINYNGTPATFKIELLNNYKVDITSYSIQTNSTPADYPIDFYLEGSNDNVVWDRLDTRTGQSWSNSYQIKVFNCGNTTFYKYFRFRCTTGESSDLVIHGFRIFGRLQNLVTGVAGYVFPGGLLDSYPDLDMQDDLKNRIIQYDSSSASWQSSSKVPWKVERITMTSDLTLSDAYESKFYILSPNGANREVVLPDPPTLDDCVRIKNLDGAFNITVKETASDPTPAVLNNAGKLQYEFVYDGVEWQVSG